MALETTRWEGRIILRYCVLCHSTIIKLFKCALNRNLCTVCVNYDAVFFFPAETMPQRFVFRSWLKRCINVNRCCGYLERTIRYSIRVYWCDL